MIQIASKNFPPIHALPLLRHAAVDVLEAAKNQLNNLQNAQEGIYLLDDPLIQRIIRSYTQQKQSIADQKALCVHWKTTELLPAENRMLEEMLNNLAELEEINQQILGFVARIRF